MSPPEVGAGAADELLRDLVRRGLSEAEVMTKRGRARRLAVEQGGEVAAFSHERAWAVRASSRRASFFVAGTGAPPGGDGEDGDGGRPAIAGGDGPVTGSAGRGSTDRGGAGRGGADRGGRERGGPGAGGAAGHALRAWSWPEPAGHPFRLPEPEAPPPWIQPSDFEAPLIGESEGLRLLGAIDGELAAELPGARLLHAALEDGSSETELANSHGIRAAYRRRLATIRLEAAGPGRPGAGAALYLAAREARRFDPKALARRLADRLSVAAAGAGGGSAVDAGHAPGASTAAGPGDRRGELLLAPPVGVALLAGLLPLLVGPAAAARASALRDRRGRIGGERLTIVDDGRLPGGACESPIDGEGVPCREVALVEQGVFRQPLLAWWQAGGAAPGTASGCTGRPGWRDLPAPGPTHLYVRPDPRQPVASLLGAIGHGHYLIDTDGPLRYDRDHESFALPVCGFAVESGRASAPVARAWLCGTAAALLQGIAAVARDLSFLPLDGMLGAPTLLVTGLALRGAP